MKFFLSNIILLLTTLFANAQHAYPVAVSSEGILLGKYKTVNNATNPLPDTISVATAKSIFAINAIAVDKEYKLHQMKVDDFQMTIKGNGGSFTITGSSDTLSTAMKATLDKIKTGDKLFFEGIRATDSSGLSSGIVILAFTIM